MDEFFPWQQANWELFNRYLNQQRVPQALLINGSKGLGKQSLATQFAKSLLCSSRLTTGQGCGHCNSCKLFRAETHPDFITITPEEEGKVIGIDAIRALIIKLALKPQFDSYRVVLINPADKLNNASANAFLKCLEEPNERTCMILLTESTAKLPATILSRCQKMLVTKPDMQTAQAWLNTQQITNAEILLNLAQGAPLLAKDYAAAGTLPMRQQCFNDWINIAHNKANPIEIAEQWHKQQLSAIIFWMIAWVVDMIKCTHRTEAANRYNPDLETALQELAAKLNLKDLYRFYDALLQSKQKLDTSINKQLMFEELLILWSQLNQGG
ncbi:MAG: DNA polymerase III subunit delta' [Methylococcaceae bacterium]|nr:DNA polymerase III subunit delta' [Methylococcaceae bacterium]